jgi:hypothetical protein
MNNNIKAGAEIHAGDGEYSIGTQEKYDEFVKVRNRKPDRIMELVRESHLDVYALGKDHEKWEATVKKFADLIVRECVRYFNEDYERDFETLWREDLSKGIKEHFGVEE